MARGAGGFELEEIAGDLFGCSDEVTRAGRHMLTLMPSLLVFDRRAWATASASAWQWEKVSVKFDICSGIFLRLLQGIATLFKRKYGRVDELKRQAPKIGAGAILERPNSNGKGFVYYLVTKARYFHKPTLDAVRRSCEWMRDHAVAHGVRTIALPRIGCGLDGLRWPDVRATLCKVFEETNIRVEVYAL